jgi:peptide/nickel transport system substrate-binding protein
MIVLVVILFLGIPVNSAKAAEDTPRWGGTIVYGWTKDPVTFNGVVQFWNTNAFTIGLVLQPLIYRDTEFSFAINKGLAEKWEVSSDKKVWTFYLRKNITWSDGFPFTAADVVFHFNEIALPSLTPEAGFLKTYDIQKIEAKDPYTVVFTFGKPLVGMQPEYAFWQLHGVPLILPKHIYQGTDFSKNPANWEPVGTGPWKLVEWRTGEYAIFEPSPSYWGRRPYLDRLIMKYISDPQAMLLALEAGEIDVAGIPFAEAERMSQLPGITVQSTESAVNTIRIIFNFRDEAIKRYPWLASTDVKRAMTLALDRETMVKTVIKGMTHTTETCVSSMSVYYNSKIPKDSYDPTEAKRLLDQAGYPVKADGWRFEFDMPLYDTYVYVGEIVAQYWKDVGIKVNLKPVEQTTFFSKYENSVEGLGSEAAAIHHMGAGWPQDQQLYSTRPIGNQNSGYYKDPRVDELLNKARTMSPTDKELPEIYNKIQEYIHESYGWIPLWNNFGVRAWRTEFHNISPIATNYHQFLEDIWWDGGKTYNEYFGIKEEVPTVSLETIDEMKSSLTQAFNDITSLKSEISSLKTGLSTATDSTKNLSGNIGNLQIGVYSGIVLGVIAIALPILRRKR